MIYVSRFSVSGVLFENIKENMFNIVFHLHRSGKIRVVVQMNAQQEPPAH